MPAKKISSPSRAKAVDPVDPSTTRTRTLDTKLELLLAAEKLFALNGLLGVSIRQIVSETSQRNASTVHYHFGSREALIYAICEYRMLSIEQERAQQLVRYLESPKSADENVIELLKVLLWPSAQPIIDHHKNSYFRRFLAHSFVSDSVDLPGFIRGRFDLGVRQIAALVQKELVHLSETSFRLRWALMIRSVTYLLANLEARAEATSKAKATAIIERGVHDIAVSFAGMLLATEHSEIRAIAASAKPSQIKRSIAKKTVTTKRNRGVQ